MSYGPRFDDLGEYAPTDTDPSTIDPASLRDLRNPADPAGPVPYEYQTHPGMNGAEQPGAAPQQPWYQKVPWEDVSQKVAQAVGVGGEAYLGVQARTWEQEQMEKEIARQQTERAPGQRPRLVPTGPGLVPRAPTSKIVGIAVLGIIVVGAAVYFGLKRRGQRRR